MRKKILAVLVLICVFSSFLFGAKSTLAGQASLSLSPITGGPYQIGNTFSLNIWAKTGGNSVDTIRASLIFPANLLEAQSVSLGSIYSAPSGGNFINNNNGTIYWGAGAYGGTTSDATFATIIFRAKSAGTATISFATDSLMLSAGQAVPFIKANGVYTIETIAQAPAPSQPAPKPTTPTQQPTPVAQTLAPKTITNVITDVSKEGNLPVFEGKASIGSAKIKFEIEGGLVDLTLQSDESGNWKWMPPKNMAPGEYILKITAIHPEDNSVTTEISQNLEIAITEALEPLFDVILNVNKESKKIFPGDKFKIDMKLVNFGENIKENTITNVELTYLIENTNREEVFRITEKRQVRGRESSFIKELSAPNDLKPGQYFISARMTYGDKQEASSSDTFEIKNNFWVNSNLNILIPLVIIILIIIIAVISKFIRVISKPWKKEKRKK